jgi:HEAT repeat protein
MTVVAVPVADLEFLDRLRTSDDVWVQAAEEGRAVARHVIESRANTIVLYGPARGSTEFLRRWVVPELARHARVEFHERGTTPARADAPADIDVWDGFETCVTDPDGPGHPLLEAVAQPAAGGARHKTVLILQEDYLSRLFQLRRTVPGILDDLFEIPPMPAARFIDAVERTVSRFGVAIEDACRAALARDLDAARTVGAPGPELVAILAFEILRANHTDPLFATAEYEALGGLKGMLGRHIDFLLEHAPGGHEAIGWAVLQRAARTPVDVMTDLTGVAHRFDVPIEVPQRVLAWLEQERRVLSANTGGGHDIVPALLQIAVAAHAARVDELTENVRALLRHGVRYFAESGGLLNDQQFRRINEQRSALTTTEDEATLMLRCALGHSEAGNHRDIEHWLRRVRSETTKIEILIDMLFDIRPELRARAATCLRGFNTPDVRAQLHLVALREADDHVRAAAVDSLGVLRTQAILSDLIRETRDPNSPFQLQAIEALRVFPEKQAVDALLQIVGGDVPGHDQVARARAIAALGAEDTDAARNALVHIALRDPDRDDRAAAVAAIGTVPSEEAAAHVLAAVSEPDAPETPAAQRQPVWARGAHAVRIAILATAAVIANTFVHGLLLMTIRSRGRGLVITAIEAAIVALLLPFRFQEAGIALIAALAISWTIGHLVPTCVLLRRRMSGVPMTAYERGVGRVLFILGCATAFLLVHGLPSMLTRHVKRGVMLTAFQAAGVVLILLSRLWHAEVGLDQPILRAVFGYTNAATWTLYGIGILIFATTYVLGIRTAATDLFTTRDRRIAADRRNALYLGLLANRHAVAVVMNDLQSPDPRRVAAATALCDKYTRILRPALRARWQGADTGLKARIASMIVRHPDQASVELLQGAATTRRDRRRAARAMWKLRLSIWPPVARVAVFIGLATLGAYVIVLQEMHANSAHVLLEAVKSDERDRLRAIERLGELAQARPVQVEEELGVVLDRPSTSAATRRATIETLMNFGTAQAVDVLRHFVERAGGEPTDRAEVDELKLSSIAALGRMQNVWALSALMQLDDSIVLTPELKATAHAVAKTMDPLVWSEYHLERSNLDEAISTATVAAKKGGDPDYAVEAALALAKGYTIRGLAAYERRDYAAAMHDLTGAMESRAPVTQLGGAISLAQQLGYTLHETVALVDPAAYELSYRAYKSIELISRHFGEAFAIDADGNLAESALTSGRFDEALRLARTVAGRAGRRPESEPVVVPMRIVEASALALQGNEEGAKTVLASLEQYTGPPNPTWQYDGTVHYLNDARLAPGVRHALLVAIRRAVNPTAVSR